MYGSITLRVGWTANDETSKGQYLAFEMFVMRFVVGRFTVDGDHVVQECIMLCGKFPKLEG